MFFAALFAMYFTLRSVMGPDHWKEMASALNFPFSATNTTILVLSSSPASSASSPRSGAM